MRHRAELLRRSRGDSHRHQWSRVHGGLLPVGDWPRSAERWHDGGLKALAVPATKGAAMALEHVSSGAGRSALTFPLPSNSCIARELRRLCRSARSRGDRPTRSRSSGSGTHTGGALVSNSRRGPEVVPGRIDGFAAGEGGHYVGWPMAEAEGRQADQGAVVGLERDSQIELEYADRTAGGSSLPRRAQTLPRSRGPSNVPPVIGAITRVPWGTAPSFCGGGTST